VPDKLTGYAAAQAITAALLSRTRTGAGQHIKLSMLDTVVSFLWGSDMGGHTFVGDELSRETAQSFIDLIYETSDGHVSVAVQSNKEWRGLCRAFEKPQWLTDERFKTAALRHENIDDRLTLTQEVLRTRTSSDWLTRLEAEDVPCAPVLTRREAIRHPQINANESIVEIDHPQAGRLRQARPAPRFSKTPTAFRYPAPPLGAHTEEILLENGFSPEEVEHLAEQAVVKLGTPV
jgi:crotonobetainyl-CoA:carnitine CoA-transferase CaiB-like acyl-CoA transferase